MEKAGATQLPPLYEKYDLCLSCLNMRSGWLSLHYLLTLVSWEWKRIWPILLPRGKYALPLTKATFSTVSLKWGENANGKRRTGMIYSQNITNSTFILYVSLFNKYLLNHVLGRILILRTSSEKTLKDIGTRVGKKKVIRE